MKALMLIATLPLFFISNVSTRGINCANAETQIDEKICLTEPLLRLDKRLGELYQKQGADASLRKDQKLWLLERDACLKTRRRMFPSVSLSVIWSVF